jgi:putative oxidoreductase
MNNPSRKKEIYTNLLATLLIFLFMYTALSKLFDIKNFRFVISQSPISNKATILISVFIPLIELFISALLFSSVYRKLGFLLSAGLLFVFTAYIIYMLLYVPDLPCSCGGIIQQMSWTQHLLFNSVFTILSLVGWKLERNYNKDFIAINRHSRKPV